jgi:hypothetical protein
MVVRNMFFMILKSLSITFFIARLIWRIINFMFNIPLPANSMNMFENWPNGVEKKAKAQIRVGLCVLVWGLWNCRNDTMFHNIGTAHFFYRLSVWLLMDPRVKGF